MTSKHLLPLSLKTRITLTTLVIFLASLWALSYYANSMLQQSMQRQIGEQQFSTVSLIADQINDAIEDRLRVLENVARRMTPALLESETALQAFLEDRPASEALFNGGVMILNRDGTVIADVPLATGRVGVNLIDRDSIATALKEGKVSISEPVMGRKLQAPIFHMTVPVRNARGNVIAALSGVTNLGLPNFLDKISKYRYGKTGGYFIMAPKYRLIVTATDKSRIMEILPPPGVNPLLDRRAQGYEGSEIFRNPKGVEVLSTAKGIPLAGWYASVVLPAEEAFAPINEMKQRIFLATLFLTLLTGGLSWWFLRLQFSPLLDTAKTLAKLADTDQPPQPLPITRQDEIGLLIGGFNRLLDILGKRETTLKELFDEAPISYHEFNSEGRLTHINHTELSILGYTEEEMLGHYVWEFVEKGELSRKSVLSKLAGNSIPTTGFERNYLKKDGTPVPFLIKDRILRDSARNITGIRSAAMDITDQKLADKALRISEERYRVVFEASQDVININRLSDGLLIEANQSFYDIHGFDRDEVAGRTAQELNLWFEPADRQRFVEVLQRDSKCFNLEARFRRKNGELIWGLVSASVLELDGVPCIFSIRRDITDRKQAEEQINYMAYFDQLTGLPNRTLLQNRLKQVMASSQRSGRYGALLLLDLDYFKTLNDTLGHDMGDLLLKQVAQRLTGCVREEDTVARFGGDEFVVMLATLSESLNEAAFQVELIGRKISAAFSLPFALKDIAYLISPSIGASVFLGQQTDIDMLLKQADLAMYKAKETGRNALRFFDPDMAHDVLKRAALENDLREAVQKQQFILHYQAQISSNQVVGAEVLLRWQRPERGLVPPFQFITVLEETGLILPVGQWVLEMACQQLVDWAAQSGKSHLVIAVNISARQLNDAGFVDQVLMTLERSGANPERLKLELTESLLVNNIDEIIEKMTALKAKGVGFSLDDFGTGYSSLSYLKRLPLDQLKIDQSFVRDILTDPNDAAIAKMIVVLAETLGLAVIAEGVETEAQKEALSQQGCHAYQGYLFSRPVPLDEFESLVKRA